MIREPRMTEVADVTGRDRFWPLPLGKSACVTAQLQGIACVVRIIAEFIEIGELLEQGRLEYCRGIIIE